MARPLNRYQPLLAVAVLVMAAGCGSSTASTGAAADPASTATATSSATAEAPLTLDDAWVKAAPSGMTALFGTLRNTTDADITLVAGSSPAAGMVELHEVVTEAGASTMRPKAGGFVVPAGGTHELAPGADHLMLMNLTGALSPGDMVEVTLITADGQSVVVAVIAKEFAAGNEDYQPSTGGSMSPAASSSS